MQSKAKQHALLGDVSPSMVADREALSAVHSEPESPGRVLAAYPNLAVSLSAKPQKYIQHQQQHGWGQDRGTSLEHLDNCLLMNVTQLCAASLGLRENIKALLSSGWVKCKALTSNNNSLQESQPISGMHLLKLGQLQLSRVARTLSEPVPVSLSDVDSPVC